jgi:hypothetical protein
MTITKYFGRAMKNQDSFSKCVLEFYSGFGLCRGFSRIPEGME